MSAHRTPDHLFRYAEEATGRGIRVIIAGAGGAAHLPGMLAAKTVLPVIGVPIPTQHLGGMDSLLSIVQMPRGIPVATVAIGNATNAGLLAAAILAVSDEELSARLIAWRGVADTGRARRSVERRGLTRVRRIRATAGRPVLGQVEPDIHHRLQPDEHDEGGFRGSGHPDRDRAEDDRHVQDHEAAVRGEHLGRR